MNAKSERFEMRLDQAAIDRLDRWRQQGDRDLSRAEAVRQLVERGLEAEGLQQLSLTGAERLMLTMLAEIQKATVEKQDRDIDPDLVMSAITGGHHWALEWELPGVLHHHVDDRQSVSDVVNYLDMWDYAESSFAKLSAAAKARVDDAVGGAHRLTFRGFDGNNETEHMSIARFLIEKMDRFQSFAGRPLNSHAPMIGRYAAAYRAFEPIRAQRSGEPLTEADLIAIGTRD